MKPYLSQFRFPDQDAEWQFFAGQRRTCYDSYYPFQVLAPRGLQRLEIEGVYIPPGCNGSG